MGQASLDDRLHGDKLSRQEWNNLRRNQPNNRSTGEAGTVLWRRRMKDMGNGTVQIIGYRDELDRERLAGHGLAPEGPRSAPRDLTPEERQQRALSASRKAKTRCRDAIIALGCNAMVTVTTRETGPRYLAHNAHMEAISRAFVEFNRRYPAHALRSFVAVPERHPTNPQHWHLHLAVVMPWGSSDRTFPRARLYACINAAYRRLGLKDPRPGRKHVAYVKVEYPRTDAPRAEQGLRLARYLSKYITKSFDRAPQDDAIRRRRFSAHGSYEITNTGDFWDSRDMAGAFVEAYAFINAMGATTLGRATVTEDYFTIWIQLPEG